MLDGGNGSSASSSSSCPGCRFPREAAPAASRHCLAAVLILTIVGDLVGNALVILAVLRNRKLRNAGKEEG